MTPSGEPRGPFIRQCLWTLTSETSGLWPSLLLTRSQRQHLLLRILELPLCRHAVGLDVFLEAIQWCLTETANDQGVSEATTDLLTSCILPTQGGPKASPPSESPTQSGSSTGFHLSGNP